MAKNIEININDNGLYELLYPKTTATNTSYSNSLTSSIITSNTVQGAIDQLFTSVSNGKISIASAITDKGVSTSSSDSFSTMSSNIRNIPSGNIEVTESNFAIQSISSSISSDKLSVSVTIPSDIDLKKIDFISFYESNFDIIQLNSKLTENNCYLVNAHAVYPFCLNSSKKAYCYNFVMSKYNSVTSIQGNNYTSGIMLAHHLMVSNRTFKLELTLPMINSYITTFYGFHR